MFFIRAGFAIAWFAVVLGGLRVAMGFAVAFGTAPTDKATASRVFLGSATTGEAIDQGTLLFASGIVIGLLAVIARALHDQTATPS